MSKLFVWLWLINKRLLKKPSFICILAFSLVFVFAFSFSASDGAMLKVAVASEAPGEPLYKEILSSLENGGIIGITEMSRDDAIEAVVGGKADAAWIFPSGLDERIGKYVNDVNEDNFVVTVIQREESVLLQISREKLMSALYPHLSMFMYSSFMELRYPEISDMGTVEFEQYYDSASAEGEEMFRIVTPQGSTVSSDKGILLSPIRGILSVLAVIGGLAVSLYSIRDERDGCFNIVPEKKRFALYVTYNLVAVFDIALVSLAALAISGLAVSFEREILLLSLFVFSAVAFSTFLRIVFAKESVFGVLIPFVAVVSITLCPVFININIPVWLRLLLPTYGYLAGVYSYSAMLQWVGISCLFYIAAYTVFLFRISCKHKI